MSTPQGPSDKLVGFYSIYKDKSILAQDIGLEVPENVILGVAEFGRNDLLPFTANSFNSARKIYGANGDLIEQANEFQDAGGESAWMKRICGKRPYLSGIGKGTAAAAVGLKIECIYPGEEWGTRFGMTYGTNNGLLRIFDMLPASKPMVFSNDPNNQIDRGFFVVTGELPELAGAAATAVQGTSADDPVYLSAATAKDGNMTWYGGDNGLNPSKMELFQGIMNAYLDLDETEYSRLALPSGATLNCPTGTFSPTVGTNFPVANSATDLLVPVYIEYYNDEYLFYWDTDEDNAADLWSVNDAETYTGTSKGGHVFTSTSFKMPSFAYFAAYHAYKHSYEVSVSNVIVPVEPPTNGQLSRPSSFVGSKPTYSTSLSGEVTVTENGSGLLGHKYVAGSTGFRSATSYGGFILTDEPYYDSGTELTDANDAPIDIGKHVVLWCQPENFSGRNGVRKNQPYTKISPAAYMGWSSQLPLGKSPANSQYKTKNVAMKFNKTQREDLVEMRYTFANADRSGTKIVDGYVASRPDSDYTRQGTMRVLQALDDSLREAAAPFLEDGNLTAEEILAMENALREAAQKFQPAFLDYVELKLVMSAADRISGTAKTVTEVKAPFELRKVVNTTTLTA